MRRPVPHVIEYKHSNTSRWVIEGYRENGKRKRLFFKTRTAAEQELTRIKTKQRREGEAALGISDSLRVMAQEVAKELEPFGKTIRDAGAFYLKYLREAQRSITVLTLVEEFLSTRKRLKRSHLHQRDLKGPGAVLRNFRQLAVASHGSSFQ